MVDKQLSNHGRAVYCRSEVGDSTSTSFAQFDENIAELIDI